ncbi:uncharacterized protein ACBT44_003431 isoform 4-T5 [Syngnathus typhle]
MFNDHENAFIWRATKQLKQLTVATSGRQRRLAEGANPQNEPVMADFLVQNGHLAVLAWLHETFSGLLLLNLLVRLKMSKQIGVNVTVSFRPASCGWRDVQPCPPFVTGVHPGEFLQRLRNSACAPATGCFHSTVKNKSSKLKCSRVNVPFFFPGKGGKSRARKCKTCHSLSSTQPEESSAVWITVRS